MISGLRKLGAAVQQVLREEGAASRSALAESLEQGLNEIEQEMARLRRIALENHALIEEVLKQRDFWSERWKLHGVQHSNAQGQMLEQIEALDTAIARRLLPQLNEYRKKDGLEPMSYSSPMERYKTLFGDYQHSLASTKAEGDAMPNDFIARRREADTEK
jgi:hypothetical protein